MIRCLGLIEKDMEIQAIKITQSIHPFMIPSLVATQ